MNRSAPSAVEIARAVRRGRMSARRSVEDALQLRPTAPNATRQKANMLFGLDLQQIGRAHV